MTTNLLNPSGRMAPTVGSSTASETGELDALRTSSCWELTEWDLATGVADGAHTHPTTLVSATAPLSGKLCNSCTLSRKLGRAAGTKGEHVLSPDGAIGAEYRLLKQAEAEKGSTTPCAAAATRVHSTTSPPAHDWPTRASLASVVSAPPLLLPLMRAEPCATPTTAGWRSPVACASRSVRRST